MCAMASQITSVSIVCSNVCSGADQRKHQSLSSLAFVMGVFLPKGLVTRKDVSIWSWWCHQLHIPYHGCHPVNLRFNERIRCVSNSLALNHRNSIKIVDAWIWIIVASSYKGLFNTSAICETNPSSVIRSIVCLPGCVYVYVPMAEYKQNPKLPLVPIHHSLEQDHN